MKRTALLRKTGQRSTLSVPVHRPKKCKACKEPFTPTNSMQIVCSGNPCGIAYAQALRVKKTEKEARAERKQDRAKKEANKGVPQLKKEAQEAFNRYVRLRDNGKGCFVCDTPIHMGGVGGGFDAGHIRSRSNADNLRFDERNVHGQCKQCNAVGGTKDWEMKAAAIRKLGAEGAEALYNDNAPIKWTRDGLRQTRDKYRALANQLEKQR
jgi:hypothetical protein